MNNKIAVVTGSRRGIGLSIASALGRAGCTVILSDIVGQDEVLPVLNELEQNGISARYKKCDISESEDRAALIDYILQTFGRLDVAVNNAGVAPQKRMDLLKTTGESFDRLIDINLKGTFFMCQTAANAMVKLLEASLPDYSPRIINIASVSSYASSTGRGEYCVSKAGVSMVTRLFADRMAEHGIPVFEVRPGIILTDMTAAVKEKYENMIAGGITPIKRFGYPEDVADCVMAACSGLLDFSAGQVLNADGGFHIRRL